MNADLTQAALTLSLLDPDGEFTFQTFGEREGADGPRLRRVLHGRFNALSSELDALNQAGAGIFVMVNRGDGVTKAGAASCRTAANVIAVRATFVDLDGAPIAPVLDGPIAPDWVVQSSPGRWHAYWLVDDCPLDQFSLIQSALAAKFGGDPSVKDLPRVMRVPGFVHWKHEPFVSQLFLPAHYDLITQGDHDVQ